MNAEEALDQATCKLYEICAILDMGFKNDSSFLDQWEIILNETLALVEGKRIDQNLVPH
jgi:hypothetical protein